MRTFRVQLQAQADATTNVTVSTEVIVADDEDATEAGREARVALDAFFAGYAEDPA